MTASPIAIVGMAALLPGSDDLAEYWRALVEAVDCFSDVPEQHWRIDDYYDPTPRAKDKTYARRGGFIPPQRFDTLAFGLPPSNLPATDVAQLLALIVAQRCVAEADNGASPRFDRRRTSVILGAAATTQLVAHMSGRMARPMWREGLRRAGLDEATIDRACDAIADQFVPWQESTFPGLLGNVIAGRIANRFDFGGTNCALDAACASSLAAVSMAIGELRSGRADTVLTGGVDALNDVLMFLCFSQTPALSPTGDCRPFSDRADGTMLGEGVGMLALRRLEDAERDGHRIYAVIRGLGSSSDGRSTSVYAPRAEGQALALRRAYEEAGYGPEDVELVEAHGTGTAAGDAAEFAALAEVFGAAAPGRTQWCALGSVKSQIGHTKAAAGAASLIKAALALHQRVLPPTIKVERPNPSLRLHESPFYLNTAARPWLHAGPAPRRASVSSFGFGGSNFHVTLEEYRGRAAAPRVDGSPVRLLLCAGDSPQQILDQARRIREQVETPAQLAAWARQTQEQFAAGAPIRAALIVGGVGDLPAACDELREVLDRGGDSARGTCVIVRRGRAAHSESVAFVFPGQGSQSVAMGRELAVYFTDAAAAWQQADAVLARGDRELLSEIVFPCPAFTSDERTRQAETLRATRWAQPALGAASLAQLALLDRIGARPAAVAGHSFGELVALHAAGVFDADTLLRLARERGEAMEAPPVDGDGSGDPGGMLAVAASADVVAQILGRHGDGRAVLANDNHPRQTVVSGPAESLRRLEPHLAAAALPYQPLPVAAAFHSPLVAHATERLARTLDDIRLDIPALPVIANATAMPYPRDAAAIRTQLAVQLASPVRFRESVITLYELGCRIFVEVGAGSVLTGLVTKCLADRPHVAISLDEPGTHGVRAWWRAVAELATLGLPLDLAALHRVHGPAATPPPLPSGAAVATLTGAHFGKPYPPASTSPVPAAPPRPAAQLQVQNTIMSDRPSPTVPAVVDPALHDRVLEAQRLTQQAILESFSMTLRSIGGAPTVTAAPLPAPAPMALPAPAITRVPTAPPAAAPPAAVPAPPLVSASGAALATSAVPLAPASAPSLAPASAPSLAPASAARLAPASVPSLAPASTSSLAPASTPPLAPASAARLAPASVPSLAPVSTASLAPQSAAPLAPAPNGAALVLAIIADKTGYPVEALGRDMELEADLGIDSIKRVEILSAVSKQLPSLDASRISPADVRRISDLLALLEEVDADPQPAAAR